MVVLERRIDMYAAYFLNYCTGLKMSSELHRHCKYHKQIETTLFKKGLFYIEGK